METNGTSLWLDGLEAPPFDGRPPAEADVVLIGGGIAGVSAALWLARGGARVALLEAGRLGGRASGRNDGQVLLGLGEPYHRIVNQLGRDDARKLWQFIESNHALLREVAGDADWAPRFLGGLRLAVSPHEFDELGQAAELLAAEGFAHELWPTDRIPERLPSAAGFHGALYLPGDGVVHPVRLVHGLANRAREAGATIHPDCAVRAIEGEAGAFTVRTDEQAISAAVVVHATSALGRELDRSGFLERAVFAFRGQILASDPLPDELVTQFDETAMSTNFCYEYFRLHGGRFVVGGMRWAVPGEEQGVTDDSVRNPDIDARLREFVERHFPTLREVRFATGWTGIMAGTDDGLPLCGELPGRPGEFAFGAFNGYGLSCAFGGGRVLADRVLNGQSNEPAAHLLAPRRLVDHGR